MDGIILFGIIGVVFFFLGPIGFFIALGNGRRIGTLEREVAGLRADLKSGAAAVSPPVAHPAAGSTASEDLEAALTARTAAEPVAPQPIAAAAAPPPIPPQAAASVPVSPPPPPPEEAVPSAPFSSRHCQSNGRSSAYGTACPNPSGC